MDFEIAFVEFDYPFIAGPFYLVSVILMTRHGQRGLNWCLAAHDGPLRTGGPWIYAGNQSSSFDRTPLLIYTYGQINVY